MAATSIGPSSVELGTAQTLSQPKQAPPFSGLSLSLSPVLSIFHGLIPMLALSIPPLHPTSFIFLSHSHTQVPFLSAAHFTHSQLNSCIEIQPIVSGPGQTHPCPNCFLLTTWSCLHPVDRIHAGLGRLIDFDEGSSCSLKNAATCWVRSLFPLPASAR